MESVIRGYSVSAELFEKFEEYINGRNTRKPCKGRKGTPHVRILRVPDSPESTSTSGSTISGKVTAHPGETPLVRHAKGVALMGRRINFDLPEDEGSEG